MESAQPYQLLRRYLSVYMPEDEGLIDSICSKFKVITARRNQVLLSAGEVCKHLYFVNSGSLRIYLLDRKGKESTRFLIPYCRFGTAFPSFVLQEASASAIQRFGKQS